MPDPQPAIASKRAAVGSLRDPGRILLLSCYELGHAPLGLASPAGFLQAAGYAPALQDLATERLDPERVQQAALVAISVPMHTALRLGIRAAERVREHNPRAMLCFYGLYAGLNADLLLSNLADAVIGGEYEPALLAYADALDSGSPDALPGVSTREHRSSPRMARTALARPAREALRPLGDYAQLEIGGELRAVGYTEASRGCKHLCAHCPIPSSYAGRFFVVDPEVVLDDIAQQVALGAQHITLGDPDFLNGPGHARRVVAMLHERFPNLTYDVTIKVEHLLQHQRLLPELARTGCLFIVTAAESLNEAVLQALNKGHTAKDLKSALDAVRMAGIAPRPTWVPFTPWETLESYLELLAFIWREGLVHHVDPVHFAIRLLVPPGSLLLDSPHFAPVQGPLDPDALTCTWRHPDPRMDALQREVSEIVERAAAAQDDAVQTFLAIHAAACRFAGPSDLPRPEPPGPGTHPKAPRLTETWFC